MPFKFKDLIVTLVPRGIGPFADSGGCDSSSGGCGGTCDGGSGGTVGSCTSECNPRGLPDGVGCGQSDEFLDPLKDLIDPPFMVELRLMLRLAIARTLVARVAALEAKMQPHTLQEVDALETRLKGALTELSVERARLEKTKG